MKKSLLILVLTTIMAAVGFGQKTNSKAAVEANAKQQSKISSKNKKSNNSSNVKLNTALEAELQKTLDVKNSKLGDEIVLKVTQSIKQDGEVIVPKGAKIIGRVTEVKEKTKASAMSKLGVVFDRIEGKNLNTPISAPISATITSITNVASRTSAGNDLFSSDTSANSSSAATVSKNGSSGGGLLGGVTNTVGGVVNTTTNTVGGATRTVGNTVSGIRISQSANASANGSTTLSAENKNLKVEKGATFKLFVNESVEN